MSLTKKNPKVELTLDKDRFDRGLDAAGRKLRQFARDGARSLGDLDRSTGSMLAGFGKKIGGGGIKVAAMGLRGLGGAAAIGGLGLGLAFDSAQQLEHGLARYQIATESGAEAMAAFREQLSKVSRDSGIGRREVLAGAASYVALTGDAAGAAGAMSLFAKVSNASGSSMADVAATAAAMRDNLKIDPKDFEAAFSALHVQGKAGAVELRELAQQMAGVAPSFAQFKGGEGAAGLAEMGAALQVMRKGFGTTSEAATGMRALMVSIQRNAGKFRKAGVNVFDKDPKTGRKTLKDFSDIVDAIGSSKLAQDPDLLTKAFGSDEAKRAYDQLIKNRGLFDDLIARSKDKAAIDRDSATYLASPAARMSKAWNEVKLKLAEVFTPERIELFAGALEKVVGATAAIVDNLEMIAARMGGTDRNVVDKGVAGQIAAISAGSSGRVPQVSRKSFFSDKETLEQSTNVDVPVLDVAEGVGRSLLGRELNYRLGAQIAYAQGFTKQQLAQRSGPSVVHVPVTVQIDGAAVAKATANAPIHRLSPGGR